MKVWVRCPFRCGCDVNCIYRDIKRNICKTHGTINVRLSNKVIKMIKSEGIDMADVENFRVFFTDPDNKFSAKINEEGVKLFYGSSYKTWTWEQLYNQAILEAMNPKEDEKII